MDDFLVDERPVGKQRASEGFRRFTFGGSGFGQHFIEALLVRGARWDGCESTWLSCDTPMHVVSAECQLVQHSCMGCLLPNC